jgi:general secretion pathway protein C
MRVRLEGDRQVNLDILFRSSFPALICVLIATAAYFQASGFASLLTETLLTAAPEGAPRPPIPLPASDPDEHATSAAPILARNPFNSIQGALDVPELRLHAAALAPVANNDPSKDPACDSARVLLIIASDDPAWSFAAIAAAGQRTLLRRQGDEVAGRTVHAIAWDRVWLTVGGTRCQLRIGDRPKVAKPAALPAQPTVVKPNRSALPKELAAKIQKISEREFTLDRTALETILDQQAELMRSTRIYPTKQEGRVTGFRLQRVASDSLLGTLGLRNGDQIRSINGFELTDPQRALEAYARLRVVDHLSVAIQRGGKDMIIDFHIR